MQATGNPQSGTQLCGPWGVKKTMRMIPHSRMINCEFMENIKDMPLMGSTSSQPVADTVYLAELTNRPGTERRELATALDVGRVLRPNRRYIGRARVMEEARGKSWEIV